MSKLTKALTAAAGNAGESLYVEDVFSTYLYTGTGSARAIDNGIPLSDKGGLVWLKSRSNADNSYLFDTVNGPEKTLSSNETAAGANYSAYWDFPSAGTEGFNLKAAPGNYSGWTMASWSFRKAEKFFDVVTYTGDGVSGRTVAHNLGVAPAVMLIKRTSASGDDWAVYHSSLGATKLLALNTNGAQVTNPWLTNTAPTDSVFTLNNYGFINASGSSYVAYLFASDAGGFGDDGSENIIKCGTFSGTGQVDLGFEPQWVLTKPYTQAYDWEVADIMRRFDAASSSVLKIEPNTSNAEAAGPDLKLNATGFNNQTFGTSYPCIYIAIRRPMKTPESGTEVFNPTTAAVTTDITNNFPADLWFGNNTSGDGGNNAHTMASRLTGLKWLKTVNTDAEATASNSFYWDSNTTFRNSQFGGDRVEYFFKRATGFFDVVAYSGTGSAHTEAHNLGVVPELIILKGRSGPLAFNWAVYSKSILNTESLFLNHSDGKTNINNTYWNSTTPTNTNFSLGSGSGVNASGGEFIAYLFASLDGVSKVGSYTGNATNTAIDCGFSNGARFILIKRTDAIGDWFLYDSARGITTGVSPYLVPNSSAAEVTSAGWLEAESSGFLVNDNASTQININNATYIFLAIA